MTVQISTDWDFLRNNVMLKDIPDRPIEDTILVLLDLEKAEVKITKALALLADYEKAAQEFVTRVDNGEVRSKYTYGLFKGLLSKGNQIDQG